MLKVVGIVRAGYGMRKLLREVSLEMAECKYQPKYLWVLCSTICALTVRVEVAVGTVCRGRCDGCSFEVRRATFFQK